MNKLPDEVYLAPDDIITWSQYATKKARDYNVAYHATKVTFSTELVTNLANICLSDEDLPEESPAILWTLLEDICKELEQSEIYATKETMTNDTAEQEAMSEVVDATIEYSEAPKEVNNQELLIITAGSEVGTTITMAEAKALLEEKFILGENNCLQQKPGALVTPMDLGRAMCFGARVAEGGSWLYADAVAGLIACGHTHSMEQLAASLGKSDKTLYNLAHTAQRVPQPLRDDGIPITVYSELVNRKYSDNPAENKEIMEKLCNQANIERFSCDQARGAADMAQGKDKPITDRSGAKKLKYRYIIVLPGVGPMYAIEEPAWSAGAVIIDLKTCDWLQEVDKVVQWTKVPVEPVGV